MPEFTIHCSHDGEVATLRLSSTVLFPSWECIEGAPVWGDLYKGKMLPPTPTGDLDLSGTALIYDWKDVMVGSTGTGDKLSDMGTFPEGNFTWECTSKN